MDDAACLEVGVDVFFIDHGSHLMRSQREALKICASCPVRQACLDYAVRENIQHGIWGGETVNSRRKLARRLKK